MGNLKEIIHLLNVSLRQYLIGGTFYNQIEPPELQLNTANTRDTKAPCFEFTSRFRLLKPLH